MKPDKKTIICIKCKGKFKVDMATIANAKISLTRLRDDNQELYIVPCPNCGAPNRLIILSKESKTNEL